MWIIHSSLRPFFFIIKIGSKFLDLFPSINSTHIYSWTNALCTEHLRTYAFVCVYVYLLCPDCQQSVGRIRFRWHFCPCYCSFLVSKNSFFRHYFHGYHKRNYLHFPYYLCLEFSVKSLWQTWILLQPNLRKFSCFRISIRSDNEARQGRGRYGIIPGDQEKREGEKVESMKRWGGRKGGDHRRGGRSERWEGRGVEGEMREEKN